MALAANSVVPGAMLITSQASAEAMGPLGSSVAKEKMLSLLAPIWASIRSYDVSVGKKLRIVSA